jgi:hypothetical protein
MAKKVVESKYTMHLGTRQIQLLGYISNSLLWDRPHRVLNVMKNWKQCPRQVLLGSNQILNCLVGCGRQHDDLPLRWMVNKLPTPQNAVATPIQRLSAGSSQAPAIAIDVM